MDDKKKFYLECGCHAHYLVVDYYKWGNKDNEEDIFISHLIPSFYANQQPIRNYFRRMFKMIWCAISGKEFYIYEINVTRDRFEEFKKFIASI